MTTMADAAVSAKRICKEQKEVKKESSPAKTPAQELLHITEPRKQEAVAKLYRDVLLLDFEDHERLIAQWLQLTKVPAIQEYLQKLHQQCQIGIQLSSRTEIEAKYCGKLLLLLKCARRPSLFQFFEKEKTKLFEEKPHLKPLPFAATPPTKGETSPVAKFHRLITKDLVGKDGETRSTQFEYLASDGSWIPYPRGVTEEMWRHIHGGKTTVFEHKQWRIDFSRMVQSSQAALSESVFGEEEKEQEEAQVWPIRRSLAHWPEGPAYWWDVYRPYDIDLLFYDTFDPEHPPHPDIEEAIMALQQGCPDLEIVKVEINTNCYLWDLYYNYRNKKRELLGPDFQEMALWHGTSHTAAPLICKGGFNRTFVVSHRYGRGTYFAASPRLSARSEYAALQPNVCQTLLYCYVVLGRLAQGNPQDMEPSQVQDKTGSWVQADSTVDSLAHPRIYTTYTDMQAFPAVVFTVRQRLTPSIPSIESESHELVSS